MFDDVKAAWRSMWLSRGFALSAIVTLALGVGANAAIFSVADAVLFRPLPYAEPDRVFVLQVLNRERGTRSVFIPFAMARAVDDHHSGLSETAQIESLRSLIVPGDDGAESVTMAAVTPNYFHLLGIRPAIGRLFDHADRSHGQAAMLSYAAWQQRFGGRDDVLRAPVTLGGRRFDIIGVLPRDVVFPTTLVRTPALVTIMPPPPGDAKGGVFHPVVRLEPGVSREQAQAELDQLVAPMFTAGAGKTSTLVLDDVRSVLFPVGRPIMRFLLAAALLVLLVGCSNLANMVLARSRQREREIGIRAALGAGTLRIVRPVIVEGLLIGVAGAALALLITVGAFDVLLRQVPPLAYRGAAVGVDLRVALAALVLGLIGGVLLALVPAWRLWHVDVRGLIQRVDDSGARWQPLGRPMVAVQVGVAVVLVFGTLVSGRAFLSVLRVDLGFSPDRVITVHVAPSSDGVARQAFYLNAIEALAARPDVIAAGASASLPLDGAAGESPVMRPGSREPMAEAVHVLPGFFETASMRLLRGRLFVASDVSGGDAAVVSESAARALFSGRDGLGETLDAGNRRVVVVGVVSDVVASLSRPMPPRVYVLPREATRLMTLLVRTRTRQDRVLADVKRAVSALAPGSPVTAVWWEASIGGLTEYRNPRFQTVVLTTFATLALGLSALGLFAVVSFTVAARTKELGIRLALGSSPRALVMLVLRHTMVPVAAGLALGLVATRGLARLAEAQLFSVQTRDPVTLVLAAAVVSIAALAAAYFPARRAGRVDPVVTLRAEV